MLCSRRYLSDFHGAGVRFDVQSDEQIGESGTERTRQVFRLDGVQQLFLIDVRAERVGGAEVGLEAQRRVQLQRVSVEAQQSLVLDQLQDVDAAILFRDVHGQHRHRILAQHTPSSQVR